ncbi:uncharacterized protein LOC110848723 [Folsomia candida]|uniref:Uncharacterized protein n=1 Tax=Folsomia candida TaxID=158441 RepID=A0A226EWI9_FOLCA|nr:uncharacterized protein LOC110848723 [Folsomia candida]OXA61899.1 hypothetical protein Fcan01_02029 [Folsomia candida]
MLSIEHLFILHFIYPSFRLAQTAPRHEYQINRWFWDRNRRNASQLLFVPPPSQASRNERPRFFWLKEKGKKLTMKWRSLKDGESTSGHWKLYLSLWETPTGILMGTSVCFTQKEDVNEAAQTIYDAIMTDDDDGCSFRLFVKKHNLSPRTNGSIPLGIFAKSELAAKKIKWYLKLLIKALGTIHPEECVRLLHDKGEYLNDVVRQCMDLLDPKTRRWLEFSAEAMDLHIVDIDATFPGVDEDVKFRFEFKDRYGFEPEDGSAKSIAFLDIISHSLDISDDDVVEEDDDGSAENE